jgi:hypothetical protein
MWCIANFYTRPTHPRNCPKPSSACKFLQVSYFNGSPTQPTASPKCCTDLGLCYVGLPHPPRRRRQTGYECAVSGVWTLRNPPKKLDDDDEDDGAGKKRGCWLEYAWMLRGPSASDLDVYALAAAAAAAAAATVRPPIVHAPPASSEAEGQQPQEQPAAFAN